MKHAIPALLLALTVLTVVQAQKSAQVQATDTTAQTLTALEEKWVAALTKSDTAMLDSILSDSYVDTDEHGQRTDKQGVKPRVLGFVHNAHPAPAELFQDAVQTSRKRAKRHPAMATQRRLMLNDAVYLQVSAPPKPRRGSRNTLPCHRAKNYRHACRLHRS